MPIVLPFESTPGVITRRQSPQHTRTRSIRLDNRRIYSFIPSSLLAPDVFTLLFIPLPPSIRCGRCLFTPLLHVKTGRERHSICPQLLPSVLAWPHTHQPAIFWSYHSGSSRSFSANSSGIMRPLPLSTTPL